MNSEEIKNLKYDIITPSWNQSELTVKCLNSIKEHSNNYRVIFIDNCSHKKEFEIVYNVLKTLPHKLIRNSKNTGFVQATNQGLQYSTAPYVVLMNNDTEAVHNWLEKLNEAFIKYPEVGLSGPLTTARNSWQGKWPKRHGILLLPNSSMLAFFCTMIKREVIEKIGYLDQVFGIGFGDDDDYCYRAKKEGFRLALIQDLVIPHHHRSTFKKLYSTQEISRMQQKALRTYKEKVNRDRRMDK